MGLLSSIGNVLFGKKTSTQYRVRDPEPEGLTNLRNNLSNTVNQILNSYDPQQYTKAQNIANNAFNQQSHLMTLLPNAYKQSNNLINEMSDVTRTGNIPSALTDNMNASVNNALKSSMGNMLNDLASRGVLNSSVTSSGMNNLSQNAANAYSQNYLNAYNSVLSGYGQALQGAQNNTNSLISGINAIGEIPQQAYQSASAGLEPAMKMWSTWQGLYDNRQDYNTDVHRQSGLLGYWKG